MLRNAVGVGCVKFPVKKRYEDVVFNVNSVRSVFQVSRNSTLEWPLICPSDLLLHLLVSEPRAGRQGRSL